MSKTKDITIDPITQKEFDEAAGAAFDAFVNALGDIDYSNVDFQQLLQDFFFKGFYRGAVAMTNNADLRETIHMMAEETKYQLKEK
jgi:hypothetical protein